eukprot:TRINITY_DN2815_c0_g1_i1.p1 TRINITY_DN2815_c0_g1~~TRINITY_DN2815_c0_g1_i1.p1  ORF type:complete len:216 (+),score=62.18 TRINITY_DN2815_c0_g1_i1:309-956(+)
MSKQQGRAKFDFTGKEELKQLSFKKGDAVLISNQYDNGWWAGEINGKIGYVPATYIELLPAGAPAGGVSRPPVAGRPPVASRPPVSAPASSGGAPSVASRPPVSRGPPSVVSRPPTSGPPPTVGRPPTSGGGPPPVVSRPPSSGGAGSPSGGARQVPPPVVAKPQVASRQAPAPVGAKPQVAPRGGGAMNDSDFEELDRLIAKLQEDVVDLKKSM